ncbi:translation initiation factor IF-3 [Candidatus Microgenomates bacterium]|nr:MAG: translation initiation factor IF-3 [Candidatus Microgenomates bacterium]
MIKRHKTFQQKVYYRINERIAAQNLRVLDNEGKQIGVLSKYEALEKARELGMDLVEVAPMAKPPVAKIIDFNKFLYQQAKKKQEEKRKAKVSETKEVRLGPFMNDHDLDVMIRRAKGFLEDGDKVKLVVKFIGRQITHPEFGQQILTKVLTALSSVSKKEREPRFEGKQLIVVISPERNKKDEKEKNQEISEQAV